MGEVVPPPVAPVGVPKKVMSFVVDKRRFRFFPFWQVTRWGFLGWCDVLRIDRGTDEFLNPSRYLVVPLVGEFILFDKGYNAKEPPPEGGSS